MNRRLQQFLAAENISQAQFADTIGVARASISHILAGRNKPGFDFMESISRHYPALNLEWLICGSGKMYKTAPSAGETAQESPQLYETAFSKPVPALFPTEIPKPVEKPLQTKVKVEESPLILPEYKEVNDKQIERIVIFFSDNSFKEYK